MSNLFGDIGVEVTLTKPDDFLKVRETLTRIGVVSKTSNTLYQSCHILHKQGQYAIVHFLEMFKLDGKPSTITDNDLARRNTIAKLLEEWNLVKVVDPLSIQTPSPAPLSQIKIITHKQKKDYQLVAKYSIGKKMNS